MSVIRLFYFLTYDILFGNISSKTKMEIKLIIFLYDFSIKDTLLYFSFICQKHQKMILFIDIKRSFQTLNRAQKLSHVVDVVIVHCGRW